MMKDIFVSPNGNMFENWKKAFPKAVVTATLQTVPVSEPVLLWVHADVNHKAWLSHTMTTIKEKFPTAKVVILANTPNQQDAFTFMSKGMVGYCHAYSAPRLLKELKTVVMHGGLWLGADLLQSLINATKKVVHNSPVNVARALSLLTSREKQVALEVAEGLSNKEVARVLKITERTVKAHMSAVFEKLGIKDRLQLALVLNEKPKASRELNSKVTPLKTKGIVASTMLNTINTNRDKLELSA